jgi:hypothetical protein
LSRLGKKLAHQFSGTSIDLLDHVSIDIECGGCLGMAEAGTDSLHIDATG